MALFGFGVQPGDNRTMGDMIYDRLSGNRRQEFYVVSHEEKPKKARRGWFIFQSLSPRVSNTKDTRQLMGDINRDIIRRDDWARDQGGAVVGRAGYGISVPEVDPGPPAGFEETPQIYGPPGGYWDGNGMWHDEGR